MDTIKNISIIFISIFFESLPFLLLGSVISATIEHYISNDTLAKIIPKNKILGCIVGIILGFFLPACDCAVIPMSKRLIKKKVPINVAISFMLSSPIINPVVLLSTYKAFYSTNPNIFWYRLLFGILIALIVGIIIGIIFNNKNVTINDIAINDIGNKCKKCNEEVDDDFKDLIDEIDEDDNSESTFISICKDAAFDMFEVVKYLILGALIASTIQIILPKSILLLFNNNQILSIITLMIFAYLISLCSTSDSFVGKSLISSFGKTSVLSYLLLGPMIDIKNTIVLFGNYKKNFVILLISLIFIFVFIFSLLVVSII